MRNWGVLLTVPVILLVLASLMTNFDVAVGQDEETETPVPSGDSTLTPTPTVTATQTITTTLTVTSTLTPTPVDEIIQAETPTSTVTLTRTVTQTTSPAQAYGALPPDPILDDPHAPGELVVKITSDDFDFQGALPGIPVRSIEALPLPLTFLIKVPDRYMTASLDLLGAHPQVVYVEPNFLAQTLGVTPNDPWFPSQWGLGAIGAPAAWDISTGTAGVTIAVVDTGVDLSHPDLAGKLTAGYDFVNGDSNANDDNGHGTHVAGIAAAFGNNGTGISGVSWGALIMPVKSLAADGFGTYANVSTGIIFAADNGADIINLSLGGSGTSALLQAAVQYAYAQGVVLVAASGNTGSSLVDIPARYPEVIAVSAMTSSYAVAGFSNYGAEVDFTAPGVSILSTIPGSAVGYDSGTSMAAPFASGAIAVIMDATGITSPIGIYWLLANTARDIAPSGWDARSGYGLVRLDYALGIPPPTATPTNEPEPDEEVTPTIGSGGGGGSLPPLAPTKTVTQTLTRTPPGSLVMPTASVTLTATPTPTLGASPTPTITADESTAPIGMPGLVPCYGIAIIFAGLGILFYAWRLRKTNQPID